MAQKDQRATPYRLKDARRKGQVNQSQDVTRLILCAGILEMVLLCAESSIEQLVALITLSLMQLDQDFGAVSRGVFYAALRVMAGFFLLASGSAILLRLMAAWGQFAPLFAVAALQPKWQSLNPATQIKNMFSGKQLSQLLSSLVKFAVIVAVGYWQLKPALAPLLQLAYADLGYFIQTMLTLFSRLVHWLLITLLVISLLDFAIQKYFFLKQLRMSRQEVYDEYKQQEGDPHIKGQRRAMAREWAEQPVAENQDEGLKEADMLLVNPSHYAVGLYYRANQTPLPRVVFKSVDLHRNQILKKAQQHGIPVIRFIWLTRTLYQKTVPGDYIPRETLKSVAQLYRIIDASRASAE